MIEIERNLQDVRDRIAAAAALCGRSPDDITLVAISKTFAVETISQAVAAGLRVFGENRVQEAEAKIRYFRERARLEWHLVGHLQSNKASTAAELFDTIQSVDSLRLAQRLSAAATSLNRRLTVFLQVDLGEEATKFGAARESIAELVRSISALPGLSLDGLMTIPPYFDDPERTRPYFRELRETRAKLQKEIPGCLGRGHLSMGMSHDFEVAISEGATRIRVGTAIFGARK